MAARSYLFVPGNRPERFAKALASGADIVVLDLEDAVAVDAKSAARDAIVRWLDGATQAQRARTAVRINDAASPHFADDLRLLAQAGIDAVMLPKAETAQDIAALRAALPRAGVLALVESARGIANVDALAACPGVARLVFGTLDYALDLDIESQSDALVYGAARLTVASRVAGLAAPVAGVTPQIDDEPRLLADLAWARRHGLSAKLCIHPRQVAAVHAALAPDAQALDWARRVLAAEAESRRGQARRPDDRPPGGAAGAAHAAARRRLTPTLPPTRQPLPPRPPMASTLIDSAIFQGIFSSDEMRQVWSDDNRTQKYLDIEAALARVQACIGLIPQQAADEIVSHCRIEQIDMSLLRQQTERIGYPVLGVVSQLNALCRDKLGEYCHWGATTQDITDTATVLQIREALALVDADLAAISNALAALARKHRLTPMIGRSNLQQAIPVTFGYKMAGLLSAIERHRERLAQLRPRVLVGEFAGAAGTLASLETGAMETQAGLCAELGLGQPLIAWHTIRDNIAEVGAFLGLVGGTLGKLSMDVKLMMQTEVGEVYEPYAHGRGSSSTMPQKRNPISSCYIHAAISVVRQHSAALMDAMVADHERSTGPWEIEWLVLPEAFCLMAGALKQSRFVLEGLEVDTAAMRRNIDMTHGLVMSEAVMMGLGRHIGREYAHDLVYDICRQAVKQQRPLLDLLAEHPEISPHLDRAALARLCDPANYLGQSGVMVDRVLASLR